MIHFEEVNARGERSVVVSLLCSSRTQEILWRRDLQYEVWRGSSGGFQ
jgi:hypothetical protein